MEGITIGHEIRHRGSGRCCGHTYHTVNRETVYGECFFCKRKFINICTDKNGRIDGCDCAETLRLIAEGTLDTEPLITHTYPLSQIDEVYALFEEKCDGVIKVAVECNN